MNVYIASKLENRTAVREAMMALMRAGHRITYDWTANESQDGDRSGERLRRIALAELDAVAAADALVLLIEPGMRGAWIETGAALISCIPVFTVGDRTGCIFEHLTIPCSSIEQVIEALDEMQRVRVRG